MENRTQEQLMAEVARLQAENEKLKAKQNRALSLKVSEKGGVSLYGVNSRWPITMYANQWLRVLDKADEIRKFIDANKAALSTKEEAAK